MNREQRRQNKPKKKKEKVVYIDDGSTVADMSGVSGRSRSASGPRAHAGRRGKPAPTSRAGQIRQTYFDTMRAMVGPMLITIGGIAVVFFLIWMILGFFA